MARVPQGKVPQTPLSHLSKKVFRTVYTDVFVVKIEFYDQLLTQNICQNVHFCEPQESKAIAISNHRVGPY